MGVIYECAMCKVMWFRKGHNVFRYHMRLRNLDIYDWIDAQIYSAIMSKPVF